MSDYIGRMQRFLALFAILFLTACQNAQPFDAQKFLDSIKQAGNAATHESLLDSAESAEKNGEFSQASEYYEQALKFDPNNREVQMSLADSYRRSGDPTRAIAIYDNLLIQDPKFLSAKEGKGLALMAKGDYQTPAALFDQVIKEDRTRWKSLNALGILFSTRKLYSEASQYFSEALKYQNNAGVLNNLGMTQALRHDYDSAIKNLSQAVSLTDFGSADRKRIDLNLALTYATTGKLDEARDIVSRYSSSAALEYDMSLYAHVAGDKKLADSYLYMALTEGKTLEDKARESQRLAASTVQINSDGEVEPKWTVVNKPSNSKSSQAVKSSKTKKTTKAKKPKPKIVEAKPAAKSPDDPLSKIVGAEE